MKSAIVVALALLATEQQAAAQQQQAPVALLAQAFDRCMATSAVRLTKTPASDEDIYDQAVQSCAPLRGELAAAIRAQLPAPDAAELLGAMESQSKPNFLSMLDRIRRDRAARAGG